MHHFIVQLEKSEIKRTKVDGKDAIVVPVVMARADVVMNEAVLPEDEYNVAAWNGVPVTVGHPQDAKGNFVTAKDSLKIQKSWAIGVIQNAHVINGTLRAEALIRVDRANKVYPGLVQSLVDGIKMNVSTGYLAKKNPQVGYLLGQKYKAVHTNVRPDHLAFLPNELGACSWKDGCGVRANKRIPPVDITAILNSLKASVDKLLALSPEEVLKVNCACKDKASNAKKTEEEPDDDEDMEEGEDAKSDKVGKQPIGHARGKSDDYRQICADLISHDGSPFLPDDMHGLMQLSPKTLSYFGDKYRPSSMKKDVTSNAADASANQPGDPNVKAEEIQAMIDKSVAAAVAAVTNSAKPALSDEDKGALAFATNSFAQHRASLVAKITANSKMTKEALEKFDVATLETIANGLPSPTAPVVNYGGRPIPVMTGNSQAGEDMEPPVINFADRAKKGAA